MRHGNLPGEDSPISGSVEPALSRTAFTAILRDLRQKRKHLEIENFYRYTSREIIFYLNREMQRRGDNQAVMSYILLSVFGKKCMVCGQLKRCEN